MFNQIKIVIGEINNSLHNLDADVTKEQFPPRLRVQPRRQSGLLRYVQEGVSGPQEEGVGPGQEGLGCRPLRVQQAPGHRGDAAREGALGD